MHHMQLPTLTIRPGCEVAQKQTHCLSQTVVLNVVENDIIDMTEWSFVINDVIDNYHPLEEEFPEGGRQTTHAA